MRIKPLVTTFVILWFIGPTGCPIDLDIASPHSEKPLGDHPVKSKLRHICSTPAKEKPPELTTYQKDQRGETAGFNLSNEGSFSKKDATSPQAMQIASILDIPDMQVNQEGYASSFNQKNPVICMFADRSFIAVWEDERDGDLDIFAQRNTFEGTPVGYNQEVGAEDFPKDQWLPSGSIIDDTCFVVVWIDEENFDIYGRKFRKDLMPIGAVFQINDSPIPYTCWAPAVSAGRDGKLVVVWEDNREGNNIYVRLFDSSGNPLGASFKVNDDEGSTTHQSPKVSVGPSGDFVIVWTDFRNMNADIFAQRFDSIGTKLADNILVSLDSLNEDQVNPCVSMGPNNRFMVTWIDSREGDGVVSARLLSFDHPLDDTVIFYITPETSSVIRESPLIVSDTSGRYIIAWTEYDLDDPAIYIQRLDSLGQPLGEALRLSSLQSTEGERHSLALSSSPGGSFVVAWMDKRSGDYDIYAQTVTSDGFPYGNNLLLNDDLIGANQNLPKIATKENGGFVVVWEDFRRGGPDIFMRSFDQNGNPQGDDYMVNDSIGRVYHGHPDIACDDFGNFLVVWEDAGENFLNIYAQLFDHSGNPNGENFKVNCSDMISNLTPCCDASPDGGFVVVWSATDGTATNIYGRLFSSAGEPLDTCFKVNDDTLGVHHLSPVIATDSLGRFVVAWQDGREGKDKIYIQRFASDGTKIGTNFPVHCDRSDPSQYNADLDLNKRGDFVVSWTEPHLSSTMIFAQRYDDSGSPVDSNIPVVDDPLASPENSRVGLSDDGYFVVAWSDHRMSGSDIYFQTFLNGVPQGVNRRLNGDFGSALQDFPDIDLQAFYLYSVWRDNRVPGLGFSIYFNQISYMGTEVEGFHDEGSLPSSFVLYQNFPNPFNESTTIQYTINAESVQPVHITLKIYNVLGERVRTLVNENKFSGEYQIIWDGRNEHGSEVPSGIYFYQLKVKDQKLTKKALLLK